VSAVGFTGKRSWTSCSRLQDSRIGQRAWRSTRGFLVCCPLHSVEGVGKSQFVIVVAEHRRYRTLSGIRHRKLSSLRLKCGRPARIPLYRSGIQRLHQNCVIARFRLHRVEHGNCIHVIGVDEQSARFPGECSDPEDGWDDCERLEVGSSQ
jgi:hypothetical protein